MATEYQLNYSTVSTLGNTVCHFDTVFDYCTYSHFYIYCKGNFFAFLRTLLNFRNDNSTMRKVYLQIWMLCFLEKNVLDITHIYETVEVSEFSTSKFCREKYAVHL